VRVNGNTEIPV